MTNINKQMAAGTLQDVPELKTTQNGKLMTEFTIIAKNDKSARLFEYLVEYSA